MSEYITTKQDVSKVEQVTKEKISGFLKSLNIEYHEDKVSFLDRVKARLSPNRSIYRSLNNRQKVILHTIAPLWANILQYGLSIDGGLIVTNDEGRRYNLNSLDTRSCLVGEAYHFGDCYKCSTCYGYNISFASLGRTEIRNSPFVGYSKDLKNFLNHYSEKHMQSQTTLVTDGISKENES